MPRSGLGSGVVVRENGYIVTNNHVVEGADELTVVMFDGSHHSAEVVGTDPVSDVAVIRIDQDDLPYVSLGDSENLRVGQWVMAFGSPLSQELSNTVTAGIVSALGRLQGGMSPDLSGAPTGPSQIHNFIQTDAAINPGNSGGPLVNLRGELVGINTAIVTRTGGNQGIGFAIPVNTVRLVADELIETGRVERARLGVAYGPATESLIDALDLPRGAAVVSSVESGSAADEAGVEAGDIITSINGKELSNHLQVSQIIGGMKPGETATLSINRNGDTRTVRVRLGGWEAGQTASADGTSPSARGETMEELGLSLSNVTPDLARQAGYEDPIEGVIITDVDPNSQAYRDARLRSGQVIVEVNRQRVRNLGDFEKVYREIDEGESFLIRLQYPDNGTNITALTKPS
jgi:serine protease Do